MSAYGGEPIYKFQYAPGSRHKVSAQVAGEECMRLEKEGNLTPKALVEASRPEDAPVHNEFEWDDDVAAECWRENQAAAVIRHVLLVSVSKPDDKKEMSKASDPVASQRAFVSIHSPMTPSKPYMLVTKAVGDEERWERVMQNALNELAAFNRKYARLKEFGKMQDLFSTIDKYLQV